MKNWVFICLIFPFINHITWVFFLGGGKSCSAFQFESSHCLLTEQITKLIKVGNLVHPSNKPAVLVFSVTSMPTFNNMDDLFLHSNSGEDNLKGQQKLSVSRKHCSTVSTSWIRCSMQMIPALMRESAINVLGQFSCNMWFHNPQHVNWSFIDLHQGTIEDRTRWKSCNTFQNLGVTPWILILMTMPVWVPQIHRTCQL